VTNLPLIIAEIERVAGRDAALALSLAKGGQTVYIPREAKAGHWLVVRAAGGPAAKLCDPSRVATPGPRFLTPTAKRAQQRRTMTEAREAGAPANKAAAKSGMHERSAFRARRRLRKKSQGELF